MHVKDLLFDFCQLLLLHAGPSVLVAKKLHDSQGCIANEQSTIAITGSNGTIPKTPGWLPLNATCQWNITAPVNKVFRINITASFQKPCIDNHLRIHDGPSDASDIMTEYNCNSTLVKRTFFSSGRSLWLEVKTGIPENSIAIRVSYEAQEKQECSINNTVNVPQSSTEYNFSSPYYPYGYHRNKTCGWYITAPENHVVKLYFLPKLNDWNTLKQSVHIYDVEDSDLTAISLGYWIIYSKFRFVYVVFKSDAKADGDVQPGIFVIYSAIKTVRACSLANSYDENMNIELRNASGVIKSPWYPHSFPRELENRCHWKIIAPKRKVVRIEFLSFRVWDIYVEIADRINALYPRIVKFSGKLPSFNFYSTGHELSIMVKGNGGNDGAGFIANYSSILAVSSGTCNLKNGSTVYLTGEGRTFSTPRYPLNPGKGTCNWNITVPPGEFVKVTFWEMVGHDVQNYATVYDVTNSNWHRLGTYARNYRKNEFYSIGNSVLVVFTSLYLVYPGGFFASYETLKAVPAKYSCSKPSPYWWSKNVVTLYSSQGEFASFGYPLPYPNDVECSWKIEAGAGYVIQLTFHSFHVGQSRYCWSNADHLEIFANYHGWRTGTFCGPSLPPVIQSNISSMHVYFQTDSSGRYPGFYASYKMLPDPSMGPCKDPGQDNIIPMTGETGKLFSPQYPRSFAGSIQCTWVITAPEGQFVKLKIKTLYLGPYCSDSALYIWDGQNSYSDLLNKYCKDEGFQSSQSAVFSSGRYLRVRFRSWKNFRSYVSKFDAVFEVVKQVPAPYSCTEKNQNTYLKSTSGSLASYNYPLPYDEYARCSWQFNMDSDYKIKLWFDFFNVPCKDGRVRLLNKKYCGSEKPPSVTLKNSDTVSFNSHGLDEYMGFKATYEAEKASVLSQRKIVGISVGILSVLCVAILVGYKRWKKKNRVPHGAVVHNLTNDVVIEQQQDTAL